MRDKPRIAPSAFRRAAGLLALAALLTPPDVVSQLLLAGPTLLLYELGVRLAGRYGPDEKRD